MWRFWIEYNQYAVGADTKHLVFFTTTTGLIGIGSVNCLVGDDLVLSNGTNDTMLLRSTNSGFTYEGLAYVHGISEGELDDLLEGGEFEERDFVLQ